MLSAAACRYGYDELPIHAGTSGQGGGSSGTSGAPGGFGSGDGQGGAAAETSGGAGTAGSSGTPSAGSSTAGSSAGGEGGSGAATSSGGGGSSGTPPDPGSCSQDTHGGHDYLLCSELRSWTDADAGCTVIGMRLVRIDDETENQWLFDQAITPGGSDSQVWIGATDLAAEGEWRWNDSELFWIGDSGGSAQNGLFAGWYFREPNNVSGVEHCASLETNTASPQWYDSNCELAKSYVCESR